MPLSTRYAGALKLERARDPAGLHRSELTLYFERADSNRRDWLWELGSGANWMGYHVAAFLALHDYFREQKKNPVASFLVIDQPTQVYFPSGDNAEKRESDAVRRAQELFEVLAKSAMEADGSFQLIVTEHADKTVLGSPAGIHTVADWQDSPGRQGPRDGLIPLSWQVA